MLPQHVEEEKGAAIASSEHHSLKGEFSNLFNVEGKHNYCSIPNQNCLSRSQYWYAFWSLSIA